MHDMVFNWDTYKDVITRLYVQENKQVDEIMRFMSTTYDFKPRYVRPIRPIRPLCTLASGTAMRSPVRRRGLSPAVDPRLDGPRSRPRRSCCRPCFCTHHLHLVVC